MYRAFRNNNTDLQNFVEGLTGAESAEIQSYISEIAGNKRFQSRIEENRSHSGRGRYAYWSIGGTLGTVLYAICRKLEPDFMVETGVASGVSSAHILCALEENTQGMLYSIDLPMGGQSGWVIPDYLRHRWQLLQGRSSDTLKPLLEKLEIIDIFLHDSAHSYRNMLWEFQTAWTYLKTGGLLLSHNIDSNDAFFDFSERVGARRHILNNMGGLVKV
ncbi:class I SAM-dependent methyltransferase [Chloroflexota bacterium]